MKSLKFGTAALAALTAGSALAFEFNDDATIPKMDEATYTWSLAADQDGFRPTSIWVETDQPDPAFSGVSWVTNSGSHYKPYIWRMDQTAADLNAIEAGGYRIQDVAVYRTRKGVKKYGVLAFSNTTDPAPTKWFDELTQAQLSDALASYQGRLLDYDAAEVNGVVRFSGVMRKNTGDDKVGWWYTGGAVTWKEIQNIIATKKTRLVDVCQLPNEKYHAAFWTDGAGPSHPFTELTYEEMMELAAQLGMRVQTFCRRFDFQTIDVRYSGVLVNTKNPLTRKVGNWMRARTDGKVGFSLRRIGGPVMADLKEETLFYPGGTMNVFFHAFAIADTPTAQLNTRLLPVWKDHDDFDHKGDTFTYTALPNVLRPMMLNSSDQMANTCFEFWLPHTIVDFCRNTLGASEGTYINHYFDKGVPYVHDSFPLSATTLTDLGNVYENVNGSYSPAKLGFFRANMLNDANSDGLDAVALDARATLGISNLDWNNWRKGYHWHAKGGSDHRPGTNFNGYSSVAGYLTLPFKNANGTITSRKYVFGTWVNDAKVKNDASAWAAATELIRDEVTASLASFKLGLNN